MNLKPRHIKALSSWTALNDFLRNTRNLEECEMLLRMEMDRSPKPRKMFVERLEGRGRVLEFAARKRYYAKERKRVLG